jgi:hypothetical protein
MLMDGNSLHGPHLKLSKYAVIFFGVNMPIKGLYPLGTQPPAPYTFAIHEPTSSSTLRCRQQLFPKRWYSSTTRKGVTNPQKTPVFILAAADSLKSPDPYFTTPD